MAERLCFFDTASTEIYTGIGVVGLLVARSRGEVRRFRRGRGTLIALWVGYVLVLVGVSLGQKRKVYEPGQERCFGAMCFAVTGVEEPRGFLVRGQEPERLIRVLVHMQNRDREHTGSEDELAATLIDGQGRRWEPVPGLGGVRLSSPIAAGAAATSEPVFRLADDATDLRLVLEHSGWTRARLRVGDPESYLHRPAEMMLPEAER